MATDSDKNEAITVVIEKLTEIVEEIDHSSIEDTEGNRAADFLTSHEDNSRVAQTVTVKTEPLPKSDPPTRVQPKVITTSSGEKTVILTSADKESEAEQPVVINFPVKVGNINIANPEGLIQTLKNLNYALETGKGSPAQKASQQNQGKKEIFNCAKCDYSSHNKHYLKQHVELVHNADRPFKCPFCDYAGKRSHSLKEHLVVHSSYRPYECSLCNATFRKKGHLTNHIKMHSSQKSIACSLCKLVFNEQNDLHRHLRLVHPGSSVYSCDICDYATTVKTNIIMHMHVHGNPKTYKCQSCTFSAVHVKIMMEHIHTSHNGNGAYAVEPFGDRKGPVILLKCSQCGFTTDNKAILTSHMWEHIDNDMGQQKPTALAVSEKRVSPQEDSSAVKSGQPQPSVSGNPASDANEENKGTIYHCAQCNYSSSEAYIFITHMLSHKPNVPAAKRDTGVSSGTVASVKAPDKAPQGQGFTHDMGAGLYRCVICGYSCELQRTIKAHIWKHIGNKDIDYPMFQNGPLSVYDDTPIGVPVLLGGNAPIASVATVSSSQMPVAPSVIKKNFSQPLQTEMETSTIEPESCTPHVGMVVTIGGSPEGNAATAAKGMLKQRNDMQEQLADRLSSNSTGFLPIPHNAALVAHPATKRKLSIQGLEEAVRYSSAKKHKNLNDGENVVVQEVSKVYSTPAFSLSESRHGSPRGGHSPRSQPSPHGHDTESTDSASHSPAASPIVEGVELQHTTTDSADNHNPEDIVTDQCVEVEVTVESTSHPEDITNSSDAEEQALSLLSLLQREGSVRKEGTTTSEAEEEAESEDDSRDSDGSQKTGICKSLLAVIEQLRERSKSESEDDNGQVPKAGKASTSRRRKSATTDPESVSKNTAPLDSNLNVEKVDSQFRCKLCHYSSPASAVMTTHMKLHKTRKPSECSLCNYTADSSEDLQDHVLQHCKVRTYQCKMCTSSFSYKSQLRAHMRAHNERSPFSCIHCSYQTSDPVAFSSHGKQHLEANHLCATCGQRFETKFELEKHAHAKCRGKEVLKCDECDFTSVNKDSYRKHMRWHGKAYKCDKCVFTSTNYSDFKSHGRTHEEEQELKCDLCDFVATSTRSLKSHMKRHVNDQRFVQQPLEQYKCNLCGYVCHHLPSLKSHMWRHASDASYSYEITNDVINAAIDYDTRTPDQGEGGGKKSSNSESNCLVTFRCCQCGYETVEKSKLNIHMKSHMDIIKKTLEVNKSRVANFHLNQKLTAEGDVVSMAEEVVSATETIKVEGHGDGKHQE